MTMTNLLHPFKGIIISLFSLFFILTLAGVVSYAQVQPRTRTAIWEDPNPPSIQISSYTLYYGTQKGGPYTDKVSVPVGQTTAQISLTPGTWYFVVAATNAEGESPLSDEASTTVLAPAQKQVKLIINNP